jgi:hypothetical protein
MLRPRTTAALLVALGIACAAQACSAPAAPDPTTSASSSASTGIAWGVGGSGGGGATSGAGGEVAAGTGGGLPGECQAPLIPGGAVAASGFSLQWTADLGAAPESVGPGKIAIDTDGNTLVLGTFVNALDLGSGVTLDLPGSQGGYLAKIASTGQALWARQAPLLGDAVFTDASGSIWISDENDLRTATRYDASGTLAWSKSFKTLGPIKIVPTGGGSAIIADTLFDSELDYGTDTIKRSTGVDQDAFLMKVDATGGVLWGRALGEQVWPGLVASDDIHTIAIEGFAPAPDGGMMLLVKTYVHSAHSAALLLRLDGSGNVVWKRSLPAILQEESPRLVVDAAGNSLITLSAGDFGADLGCGDLDHGLALAMTDPGGKPRWTRYFETINAPVKPSFDPSGNILLTGLFADPIDLGGGILPSGGDPMGARLTVAKLSPSGELLASRAFGTNIAPDDQTLFIDSAVTAAGDLVVALSYQGSLDLGGGPLPASPALVGRLARFTP